MSLPTLRQLTTPPNLMSLVRVPLAGLVWLAPTNVPWVLTLLALSGLSDVLDGRMARARGIPGDHLGAWLDPLCDKIFVASALVAVWVTHAPAWWLAVLASTREVLLFPLVVARFLLPGIRERHFEWKAKLLGKATTVAQFLLFGAVLLDLPDTWLPLAVTAGLLGFAASAQYAHRAWRLVRD